jgi:hypothetical protein
VKNDDDSGLTKPKKVKTSVCVEDEDMEWVAISK